MLLAIKTWLDVYARVKNQLIRFHQFSKSIPNRGLDRKLDFYVEYEDSVLISIGILDKIT